MRSYSQAGCVSRSNIKMVPKKKISRGLLSLLLPAGWYGTDLGKRCCKIESPQGVVGNSETVLRTPF